MKKLAICFGLVIAFFLANHNLYSQDIYYLRGTGNPPWNSWTNDAELNAAFGVGNWIQAYYQTVNVGTLLQNPTTCYIFMEGGANHVGPMNTFLQANLPAIEAWVNAGGNLFISSAGWSINTLNYGFGGVTLNYPVYTSPAANVNMAHPIWLGPNLPVQNTWTGNWCAHGVLTGPIGTSLIMNQAQTQTLMSEKPWGAGNVLFSTMTTTNWHQPSLQVVNQRINMHIYMYQCCDLTAAITASTNVLCFGDCNGDATVTANLGTPPYTYDWGPTANNQTTPQATGLCAGTYIVTVSDNGGCIDTALVTITEPTLLQITNVTIVNSNCGAPDGSIDVTVTGGTPNYTYLWNTNATTAMITGLPASNYCVTITDANGCTADTCVDVLINAGAVTMNLTFNQLLCNGDCSGDATATPTSGIAPYTYQWDAAALFQQTQTATGLCAGTYFVTITDDVGCTGVGQITVTEPPAITISTSVTTNYNGSDITCFGACDGAAIVNGAGGTGGFVYQWNVGQTTQTVTGLCAGTYTVTITDMNGCTKDTLVTLTAPAPVVISMSNDTTICEGTAATISVNTTGGTPFYFESWNQGLPGNGPHIVSPLTNTCYSVSVTDVNGCTALPDSVCVTVLPPIAVSVSTSRDSVCDGEDVILTVSASGGNNGPYTYTWSNNLGTTQQVIAVPTTYPNCQTYTVTVSDACSPDMAESITVCFFSTPTVSFVVDEFFGCEPLTVEFITTTIVDLPATYEWNLGDGTIINGDTITHTYEFAGQFDITLTVTSVNGCSATLTYPTYIIVNPNPVADFAATPQPTTVMNTMIDFIDRSEGSVNQWIWTFSDPNGNELGSSEEQNPTYVFPGDTGMFPVNLFVTTTDGCVHDTTKYIEINGVFNIYVPNAFTPNGDGLNDEFFPSGVGIHPDNFIFTIYDRWGEIIFSTTSIEDKWDGTAREKGGTKIVEDGVYVWRIEAKESTRISEQQHQYVGHVTLIK